MYPKNFDSNKYSSNSTKGCGLEVDLEYPTGLRELDNDYPLARDKIEIERHMLSNYQLKTFIMFLFVLLKNWCLTSLIKKSMCFIMKIRNFI